MLCNFSYHVIPFQMTYDDLIGLKNRKLYTVIDEQKFVISLTQNNGVSIT